MNKRLVIATSGVGVVLLLAIGALLIEGIRYRWAVRADAAEYGIAADDIQYPANWPLEVFAARLSAVRHPEQVEQLITGYASVDYYVAPVGGADSALVVQFTFRVGWRTNSVVVVFLGSDSVRVDGTDAMPTARRRMTRGAAVDWFESRRSR